MKRSKVLMQALPKPANRNFKQLLLYKSGRVHYDRKAYADAVVQLKKLLGEFPKTTYREDAISIQAESLYVLDKIEEAFPLYAELAKSSSEDHHPRAHYRAGQCATRLKKWADAEKHFAAVVGRFSKFPQHVEARYGLAFALQNQKQFDPARSHYQQVIKDTETETAARARFMLGECDFAQQKFDSAWEHYLEAALGYPYEEWKVQGHYQAARCFLQLKQPAKAREELEVVIEKFPQHALAKDAQQLLKTVP